MLVALLVEIVADVIGGDSWAAVDAAVDKNPGQLSQDLADAVTARGIEPPIEKRDGQFCPGWLLDYHDYARPYGNDPYFVYRGLLYSHRVAVASELHHYMFHESLPHGVGASGLRYALHKVLTYGELESNGLLSYVPPRTMARREHRSFPATDNELEYFYKNFIEPNGRYIHVDQWDDSRDARVARNLAEVVLMSSVSGIRDLLAWQAKYADAIDLLIPNLQWYLDTFTWLINRGSGMTRSPEVKKDSATLLSLLQMPTLSPEKFAGLTIREMIDLRDERVFVRWRESLASAVAASTTTASTVGDDIAAAAEFRSVMQDQRTSVLRGLDTVKHFRGMIGKPGTFGLGAVAKTAATVSGSAAAAAVMGASASTSAIVGTAGAIASGGPALSNAARRALQLPELRRTANRAFDLFAVDL